MSFKPHPDAHQLQGDTPNIAEGPPAASGEKRGHKRGRSLGSDVDFPLDQVVRALQKMERTITEEAGVDITDFSELSDVKDTISDLRAVLSKLVDDRQNNPNKIYKAVSFSAVNKTNLKEMGVEKITKLHHSAFINIVSKLLEHDIKRLETPLKQALANLAQQLGAVHRSFRIVNEAGTRIIINQVLIELDGLCHALDQNFVAWVELAIADKDYPVTIRYQNVYTTLTGVIDYGIGTVKSGVHRKHEGVKAKVLTIATVEKAAEYRDTFTLLEAKRAQINLETCLPQAIAQSIALTERKVYTDEHKAEGDLIVSFGLSNGWKWILGVICREASSGMVRCRHSPILVTNKDLEGMSTILNGVLCWAKIPSRQIWEHMEGSNEVVHQIL